ncbi:MAG: hypothetical protein KGI50_02525 [Patescibacteria group bacterium]|nr:hypothetical protein [Patescibacteria group bacterium]MDE2437779.1 hypothetical protein [Patescibacteria group bacterium]
MDKIADTSEEKTGTEWVDLIEIDEMQGASEERTEQYKPYCEGVPQLATQQIAISIKSKNIPPGGGIFSK